MTPTSNTFYGLGIAPGILEILDKLKFIAPTPIQQKAIPLAIEGKDIIGIAQTGTGKTLAFGIPMVQSLAQSGKKGLVLVPTRELAYQVNETINKLAPAFKIKTAVLIGGESMFNQIKALKLNPSIIIATPGRFIDHMERGLLKPADFPFLVLDEADRMLDMGFMPQMERILKQMPKQRQTLLFSATMPETILDLAQYYMHLPLRTEIAPSGTAPDLVIQEMYVVRGDLKMKLLSEILKANTGSVLMFTRTKRGAQKATKRLRDTGFKVAEIHSDRSMSQRKEALAGFKSGRYRILVATDIAARGIDVTGIELVLNYDLPEDAENYVHRIGRTGRAGMNGKAISFATPDQGSDIKNIERIIRTAIPLASHPNFPPEKLSYEGGGKKVKYTMDAWLDDYKKGRGIFRK